MKTETNRLAATISLGILLILASGGSPGRAADLAGDARGREDIRFVIQEARRGEQTAPVPQEKEPVGQAESRVEVAMGEWAVTLETDAVRPGSVTFLIYNRGAKTHGFRIRSQGGRGRDRFERRTGLISPGGSTQLTVDLPSGAYTVECYVEEPGVGSHHQMGMRTTLTVRDDAPSITPKPEAPEASSSPFVTIQGYKFSPSVIKIKAGATVSWTNKDRTQHTVTSEDGSFVSPMLDPGGTFSFTFTTAGTFPYKCMLHPMMQGTIEVSP